MGTRAAIIKEYKGKYTGITLNYDGYPEYAGLMLTRHYTKSEQIDALLALGNISEIHETSNGCVIAGSWGESYAPAQTTQYLSELETEDYVYLFRKDKWHVSINGREYTEVR